MLLLLTIGSPFKVPVQGEVDASKVTASGPGVDPNNCRATDSLSFKVNAKKSAKAPLGVEISGDKGPIPDKPVIKDNGDGTYDVTYKPPPEGSPCNVKVTYGGKDIKGRYVYDDVYFSIFSSPFICFISTFKMQVKKKSEPNKVKISGLKEKVPASMPAEFIVDTKEAGIGDLQVGIMV